MAATYTNLAKREGKTNGRNAASWLANGGMDREHASRFLAGLNEGDPEWMDRVPSCDLSGQWAGGMTVERLMSEIGFYLSGDLPDDDGAYADRSQELADLYEESFNSAAYAETERLCRFYSRP